jgi:nucleoside-diphosphate-sugar epimerase
LTKTRVLLTGASGSMGHEAFLELMRRTDRYDTRLILRPSKKNKDMFAPYANERALEIVWGDLGRADDVDRAVAGVDFVLHPAALISPAADRDPQAARRANVDGTRHLLEAIHRQPGGAERIAFVNIGSVAQYGDRLPPIETIRVGDPLKPSLHDYYALTKCEAERLVVESGLRRWASLRQTFIAITDLMSLLDPIMFHQPLEQCLEFITARDAGYGLVQCLEAPDEFWCRIYNMSGGPSCRATYEEFIARQLEIHGLGDYKRVFDPNFFATRNFHCGYFADSHELDKYLGHFRDTKEDYFAAVEASVAPWIRWASRLSPKPVVKAMARRYSDPIRWIRENNEPYIRAFLGSREEWEAIPGWAEREARGR